jgi:hypothetical protein
MTNSRSLILHRNGDKPACDESFDRSVLLVVALRVLTYNNAPRPAGESATLRAWLREPTA